jgi:chemotaxis protein MotB
MKRAWITTVVGAAAAAGLTLTAADPARGCWWMFKSKGTAAAAPDKAAEPAPMVAAAPAPVEPAPAAVPAEPPVPAPTPATEGDELKRLRDELAAARAEAARERERTASLEKALSEKDRLIADLAARFDRSTALEKAVTERDAEIRRLTDELAAARAEAATFAARKTDGADRDRWMRAVAERDARISQLTAELADLRSRPAAAPTVQEEPFGRGTRTTQTDEQITIAVEDRILFASGKVDLRADAAGTLARIAVHIRTRYPDRMIEVVGHTDAEPIRRSGWEDNWQLSTARSLAVMRGLIRNGVEADRCKASGRGPFAPVSTDMARNRRVEIVIWLKDFDGSTPTVARP